MAAPVIIGGVGTALSLEDVLEVTAGACQKREWGKESKEKRAKTEESERDRWLSLSSALLIRSLNLLNTSHRLCPSLLLPRKPS